MTFHPYIFRKMLLSFTVKFIVFDLTLLSLNIDYLFRYIRYINLHNFNESKYIFDSIIQTVYS
jgi:hypothetical protein